MESDTKPEAVGVALDVAVDVFEVGDGLPGADEARLEERLEECQDPVDTFTARGAIDRCAGLEAAEIAETDREIEDRTKGVEAEATEVITEKIRYAICEKRGTSSPLSIKINQNLQGIYNMMLRIWKSIVIRYPPNFYFHCDGCYWIYSLCLV